MELKVVMLFLSIRIPSSSMTKCRGVGYISVTTSRDVDHLMSIRRKSLTTSKEK